MRPRFVFKDAPLKRFRCGWTLSCRRACGCKKSSIRYLSEHRTEGLSGGKAIAKRLYGELMLRRRRTHDYRRLRSYMPSTECLQGRQVKLHRHIAADIIGSWLLLQKCSLHVFWNE